MSKKLDTIETAINACATAAISFGVPIAFAAFGAAGAAGVGTAYFILSTAKVYVLRRWFRKLEAHYGQSNDQSG